MKTLLALAIAIATTLHAQELAPELAPLVAKHKADIAALDAQKDAAIARVQQTYLAALDGAERTATTAGKLEVFAAITKEREALQSGLMAPALPEGLPKILQSARKAYLDGTARVTAYVQPRQKAIDADYLRTLAGLQARASGKPELATQIDAEKKNLLASVAGSAGLVGLWTIQVKARSGLSMTDTRELSAGGKGEKATAESSPGKSTTTDWYLHTPQVLLILLNCRLGTDK